MIDKLILGGVAIGVVVALVGLALEFRSDDPGQKKLSDGLCFGGILFALVLVIGRVASFYPHK